MSRSRRRGKSEAQANAEALTRRDTPYAEESERSRSRAWDVEARQPRDLREAVYMLRRAYADEVPGKLHEGYDAIGEGGTPKMTERAMGYIFGNHEGSDGKPDPVTGDIPIVSYYHAPFRATLARWSRSAEEGDRRRAAIVQRVTLGRMPPINAVISEGVPPWCAKVVVEHALLAFHRDMSDMKITVRRAIEEEERGMALDTRAVPA